MPGDTSSIGFLFYAAAAVYQWALAVLVLAAGRPNAVRAGVAFVLVANGAQALLRWLPWHEIIAIYPYVRVLDAAIVATLAFVLTQFPVPLGGQRGAGVARWALASSVLVVAFLWLAPGAFQSSPPLVRWFLDQNPFFIAVVAVLAVHTLPRTMRLPPGPLRVQSSLLAAGMGLVATRIGLEYGFQAFDAGKLLAPGITGVTAAFELTLGYFAAAAVLVAVAGALRERSADLAVPAVALACMAGLAAAEGLGRVELAWVDLVETALRPVLIAVAFLRFDLFRVPRALRRPLVPLSLGLFVATLFVFVHEALGGELLAARVPFALVPSLAALGVIAACAFLARAVFERVLAAGRAPADAAYARERLDRYRLALEAARADPSPAAEQEAQRLRRALGISLAEHDAIAGLLDGNVVIPTTAISGAAPGQVVLGRYEVVSELGRGGQGRVLLAIDRRTGGEVALKELPRPWTADADARRDALRREAALASRVRSERVGRVLDLAETPLETYLVRVFVPGDPLDAVVAERGPMAPVAAVAVAADVLEGLEAVHAAGLVHADVKPANVILRVDGRAVLIDQGASRVTDPDVTRAADAGQLVTLGWAAPEQLAGRPADVRTDVHQAGGVLYYLLTGKPPPTSGTATDVALAWPADVPAALRRVVERSRAADPGARFASVAEMRAALAASTATPPPPGRQ